MENQNSKKEENQMHTASEVIENDGDENRSDSNEQIQSSRRGGRKGAAQAAQGLGAPSSTDAQEQFRIVISREANDHLELAVAKACRGFDGGALTRTDIANYVFTNLAKLLSDADYKAVRALHFDERKVLSSILKSEEELPEEIRKALRDYYGLTDSSKKRPLRATAELSTDKSVDNSPAA